MSAPSRASALAPFHVRSFRFQWPADLATSWAFEMELVILGWYVMAETQSVFMLTVFASLLYLGTLLAPMAGVIGDRIGNRNLLVAMRGLYAALATTMMTFAFLGAVTPAFVLAIATVLGLVRPSDIGVRAALVGETMPAERLLGAMSIQRTTLDSARIVGALTGAGLVATLGMGPAYLVVASFYAVSCLLTFQVDRAHPARHRAGRTVQGQHSSPWRDLREGLAYVWNTPHLLAMMSLAFLVNVTAFPLFNSLMPYVAKEVYGADQTVLGYLVAGSAFGALTGSIALSRYGGAVRAGRMMIVFCVAWYTMLLVFAYTQHPAAGIPVLVLAGCAQSLGLVPMAALLLRTSDTRFHGRVMGIRMLAIYGNLPGLLISGPLIANYGYPAMATLYCAIGIAFTLLISVRWRAQLWRADAPTNAR
ncbi:MAG TPA: MFS transporter [Burkholderiales bacterium]|nr:MFS transporter [Burkholderiales bacterium]